MFRREDFKKVDLLGSGKKNTKIFKALHKPSKKYFALKEIEAKNIEKLNEYKEEAVQLMKIKNHPNVLQTYNYYFYETQVQTFRLAIVCELMDENMNLERIFRKKKQKGLYWSEKSLEKLIVSLISTLSFLQSIGICHRDIKPSNLFIMPNGEMKVIDFGESKDHFSESDDGGDPTLATIRGTPQYLSPILWKAYVVDKNTRHSTHNIYKSDVFSAGLVFFQIASMEDVTGFNNLNEGEDMIERGLRKLRKSFSEHICEILRLMLKFEEAERPSFVELAKLVLTSEENTLQSPAEEKKEGEGDEENKADNDSLAEESKEPSVLPNPPNHPISSSLGNNRNHWESAEVNAPVGNSPHINSTQDSLPSHKNSGDAFMTQADLFRNYVEQNNLFVTYGTQMFWFEAGGRRVGKVPLNIDPDLEEPLKWKTHAKSSTEFHSHVVVISGNEEGEFFILGGVKKNCFNYKDSVMVEKAPMPEKSFFSAVNLKGKIYTFGGFDIFDKIQLKQCEQYDIEKDEWTPNDSSGNLHTGRSQSSSCVFEETIIYIFGGYNKEIGTLGSVERYEADKGVMTALKIEMPTPLRRFSSIKISTTKILLIGGLEKLGKESDAVFCMDIESEYRIEKLDKIDRAGVIDYPILIDTVGNIHLFVEKECGSLPPFDVSYSFLEYS
ncbi:unnamed protein product [Moneuplotes crassus]|uniref:Protein kinase domain-containing protein n=1 Tax=Euplotes crassus TaxID=5936 RepID=A0AAD1X2C0_EUPCR|nr:unnamed protein product [Moneuplotes crassus]